MLYVIVIYVIRLILNHSSGGCDLTKVKNPGSPFGPEDKAPDPPKVL